MTVLRHISLAVMTGACLVSAAFALPHSPSARAEIFAKCSGDLGALATFRRNHVGGDHREPKELQNTFDMLLEAVLPDAVAYGMPEHQAANWRFNAYVSHNDLLNSVAYSMDERRKDLSRKASEARIEACRSLVLSAG